jgi:hypothetical protein
LDKIVINSIARVERPILMPSVVLLFTDHPRLIEMTAADAQSLSEWLQAQINAGADLKIRAGLTDDSLLSSVTQTTLGQMLLQFSPQAARDYVAQLDHLA